MRYLFIKEIHGLYSMVPHVAQSCALHTMDTQQLLIKVIFSLFTIYEQHITKQVIDYLC